MEVALLYRLIQRGAIDHVSNPVFACLPLFDELPDVVASVLSLLMGERLNLEPQISTIPDMRQASRREVVVVL